METEVMRVLVCGSRTWTDRELIADVLDVHQPDVIIHGAARGADTVADEWADAHPGVVTEAFPARWDRDGKAAGPIRNRRMLKEGKPDLVVAFIDDRGESKGTRNMVEQARRALVPVIVYDTAGIGVHR